jgi:preprotein translocase subunit YajC
VSSAFLILAQLGGGSGPQTIIFIGALFAIMYFVMIRPQQKQLKEQRNMLSALKKGDDVITQGGLLGKVYMVTDKIVTLEVASGVRLRVLKTSIQGKVPVIEEEAAKSAAVEEKKEDTKEAK